MGRKGVVVRAVTAAMVVLVACGSDQRGTGGSPNPPGTDGVIPPELTEAATTGAVVPTPAADVAPQRIRQRLEHRFELPSPEWLGAGDGSVWVMRADGIVTRIDPRTNKVTHDIDIGDIGTGERCQGLGVSDDSVWSCSDGASAVRIDPSTNEVVARVDVHKVFDQGYIPLVGGHAWFLVGDGSTLAGVSLETNEVDVEIPLDAYCVELANDEQSVWVSCLSSDEVLRIDLQARTVAERLTGLDRPRWIAAADAVWVAYDDGLARIDPTTSQITGAIDIVIGLSGGLYASEDAVWLRTEGTFLQRVDADTLALVEVITAPEPSGGSVLEAFGSLWATAYDDTVLYRLRP